MERLAEPLERSSSLVQLEILLPATNDSIWAKAEVIYDRFDSLFHGTAVRFTGMARTHQRWLREWLRETSRMGRLISSPSFQPASELAQRAPLAC
jgi:hypothetical protein